MCKNFKDWTISSQAHYEKAQRLLVGASAPKCADINYK